MLVGALLIVLAVAVGTAYLAWLCIDVRRRQRSNGWLVAGAVFGWLTAPAWLWARRWTPPNVELERGQKVRLAALAVALYFVVPVGCRLQQPWGYQVARVEGRAMAPTLNDQDRVVVDRFTYRLSTPQRGAIVMYRYPVDPRHSFVGRIVGIAGDRLEMRGGRLFRNGALVPEPYVTTVPGRGDDWTPIEVPASHVFVMADCRGMSSDSRHFGAVPVSLVRGRLTVRWWPRVGVIGAADATTSWATNACVPAGAAHARR